MRTGPKLGNPVASSVWVTLDKGTSGLFCIGTEVRGQGTSNIGPSWTSQTALPNSQNLMNTIFSSLAIGPNGEALVAHIIGSGASHTDPPVTCYLSLDNDGLGSGGFSSQSGITITNLGWLVIDANGGVFPIVPIPTLGWDRTANKVYISYPDRGSTGPTDYNTDIIVRSSSDKAVTWSASNINIIDTVEAINTTASQFHPRLAVDQITGKVAVFWYDCRRDSSNVKTHVFAAVSTDGFATLPRNFRLNPLQSDSNVAAKDYKEYIGLAFFKGFFYPAWLDNSNST